MAFLESQKGMGIINITSAGLAFVSNTSEDNNSKHKNEKRDPFDNDEKTRITNAGILK